MYVICIIWMGSPDNRLKHKRGTSLNLCRFPFWTCISNLRMLGKSSLVLWMLQHILWLFNHYTEENQFITWLEPGVLNH